MMRRAAAAVLVMAAALGPGRALGADVFDDAALSFARRLDAESLSLLGVQYRGRVAILETLAREQLRQMYGSETIDSQTPAFAYLEVFLNAGRYVESPLIYVREKNMRAFVAAHLDANSAKAFARTNRLPPAALLDDEGSRLLLVAGRADLGDFRRARHVTSLRGALPRLADRKEFRVPTDRLSLRYSHYLGQGVLRVVPGAPAEWLSAEEAFARAAAETQPAEPTVAHAWLALREAWRRRDAEAVNKLVAQLHRLLPKAAGASYPPRWLRRLERLYDRTSKSTVAWAGFAAAMVLLIVAVASRQRWARWAGLGVFALSTLLLLLGFAARWALSGRAWYLPPIMNQFEAVLGSALLGAVLALVLEAAWKRSYFALAAAFYATVSLLFGFFLPERMGASIGAQHGILASPVMTAHVAVIIVGHAFVGMTFFVSYVYLFALAGHRARAGWRLGVILPQALGWLICLTSAAAVIWTYRVSPAGRLLPIWAVVAGVALAALLIHVLLMAAVRAASLDEPVSSAPDLRRTGARSAPAVIDRCNLIIAQLACWTVIVGTILGAYWGDFAWGRWWGWDPKETWALITALVYVALLHVRFVVPSRWRGLLTACICILGCVAMLVNWIVVNYLIAGKHSYA
jgi:ABC-type transport system involved in cytochrome c biogenesis permease subunit